VGKGKEGESEERVREGNELVGLGLSPPKVKFLVTSMEISTINCRICKYGCLKGST